MRTTEGLTFPTGPGRIFVRKREPLNIQRTLEQVFFFLTMLIRNITFFFFFFLFKEAEKHVEHM